MTAYIKRKSDGKVLHSCSGQTVNKPSDVVSLENFITSRGWVLSDYVFADATEAELKILIEASATALEVWLASLAHSPMNRNREDHIKDVLGGVAGSPAEQAIYDAKILLRGNKPI
jgi:hypothetical protein